MTSGAKQGQLSSQRAEVVAALENVLSREYVLHDRFDLFLARPLEDPYLESIRQRCLAICRNDKGGPGRDLSESGCEQVAALLVELRQAL
jgi:hypothetical protein